MNKILSIMLVVSFNFLSAADVQNLDANAGLNAAEAAAAGVTARRLNSMMEAYMRGNFAASKKEGYLKYDDHNTFSGHEENWVYEDTVERINADLKKIYGDVSYSIDGWRPLDFHMILGAMTTKESKVNYLKNFTEKDKIYVQTLRLYDFLKVINMDLPEDVMQQLKGIADDVQLSDQDKGASMQKILDEQDQVAKVIRTNRLALAKAVKAGDAAQVLEISKKPLHVASFISLNDAIQKMIVDIEAGEENALCSNHSRAQAQGCIIN